MTAGLQAQPTSQPADHIRVLRSHPSSSQLEFRQSLVEVVPALRGYKAPILNDADKVWSPKLPDQLPVELKMASDVVARGLARDGLLSTLVRAVEVLGWRRVVQASEGGVTLLQSIGFPVDLLRFFPVGDADSADPAATIIDVCRSFGGDATGDDVIPEMQTRSFRFVRSSPGFGVATESGEYDLVTLRLQMSTGSYYHGVGDGGNIDLVRQLVQALPDASFLVSIEDKHLDGFLAIARAWDFPNSTAHRARRGGAHRMTVIPEPFAVSQWAQDNCKVGFISEATKGLREQGLIEDDPQSLSPSVPQSLGTALLVPRYASRREEVSAFVPGEGFLMDSIAATGLTIIQSPLLFQGGDLIAVRNPATGQRILLIGEAEIYRNTALGLTADQVVEAFRQEIGVDRCVVLPAVSYHIDYEVTVRAVGNQLVAFVNHSEAASRLVLMAGLGVLERNHMVESQASERAREAFSGGNTDAMLDLVETVLTKHAVGYGQFPESFAKLFAAGLSDSGVGNLQRLLLALDTLAFAGSPPRWKASDPHGAAYANTLRRREEDRTKLNEQLRGLGWKVVRVPSTSEADRSLNYLNGVQLREGYLMPAYGGLFSDLDHAAADVFAREFGPQVRIIPILCGESQRRVGAVRCSVCVFPSAAGGA